LQPPATGAQHDGSTGAQQVGSQAAPQAAGAQHDGSLQQDEPQLEPQPPNRLHLGNLNFGHLNFGILNFGILKQDDPQPLLQPQLSPHVLQAEPQVSTGAQHVGSTAVPQAAGAQQVGSTAGPQPLSQPAGAQQLASTGAQQVGSTLHPHP
jgi:hypothetical protein